MSDSLPPYGLQPTRLLHPWDFPGNSPGVDCHFLLQGIFPTQGSNPGHPHCRQTLYHLSHQGSPNDYSNALSIFKIENRDFKLCQSLLMLWQKCYNHLLGDSAPFQHIQHVNFRFIFWAETNKKNSDSHFLFYLIGN